MQRKSLARGYQYLAGGEIVLCSFGPMLQKLLCSRAVDVLVWHRCDRIECKPGFKSLWLPWLYQVCCLLSTHRPGFLTWGLACKRLSVREKTSWIHGS